MIIGALLTAVPRSGHLARDRDLYQFAPGKNISGNLHCRRRDECAATGRQRDNVILRERLQGAAHSRAACAEDRAQLLFRQLGSRRQSIFADRVEDAPIDISNPRPACH
jgi:hypothetical protein